MAPSVQLSHPWDGRAAWPDLSHHILGIRRVTSFLGLSFTTHPRLYENPLQSSVWLQEKVEVNNHDVRCTYLECLLMAATMRAVQPSLCLAFTSVPSSNNLERGEIWSGNRYEESTSGILELMRESRMFYCAGSCSSTALNTQHEVDSIQSQRWPNLNKQSGDGNPTPFKGCNVNILLSVLVYIYLFILFSLISEEPISSKTDKPKFQWHLNPLAENHPLGFRSSSVELQSPYHLQILCSFLIQHKNK